MKKLTAGIFATLLAVVSTGAANAEIASKGYVDQQVGTKADANTVSSLSSTVSGHTTQIGTINTNLDKKADKATTLSGYGITDAYTSAEGTELEGRVAAVEAPKATVATGQTGPVSGQTVFDAIQGVSGDVSGVTSDVATLKSDMTEAKADISALETASANHVVKNEAITGGTHTKITYDAKGLVTAGADLTADDIPTIPNTKVSGLGSLATKSSVATADIASKAVTKEKLADEIVTSLGKADAALQQADLNGYLTKTAADAAYADIATETTAQTALTNIGTLTNLTTEAKTNTVVAINEVAKEAADAATAASAADNKAGQAQTAAGAAQGAVDALEAVVNHETTGLAAAHTAIDAVEGRVTTAEGEIDTIQTTISKMATSEAVTSLTNRVTTAEGDIDDLEAAVNDAESGLAATNDIADSALSTAQSAQTKANAALPKATYDNQVGTVSATNMGTSASTVVAAIKEVADEASAAQETANAAIPKPDGECSSGTAKCVLTFNNSVYAWEVIARNGDGE